MPARRHILRALGGESAYMRTMSAPSSSPAPPQADGPRLFDRGLVRRRLVRAAAQGPETFLLDRVAEDLSDRLGAVKRSFPTAVDLGTPTDAAERALAGHPAIGRLWRAAPVVPPLAEGAAALVADEEALPFAPASLDLLVSLLALHAVNDLPGALAQIRRALKPDGLFIAALVGGRSLFELRQAFAEAESETLGGVSPRVAPFGDVRDLGSLLQRAGFALPVTDVDRIVVRYGSPVSLFQDLRRMGATNALTERRRVPLRRATLMKAVEIYAARFADPDGRVRATFEIVWLLGWAPHESQPKPLKPGSAQMRLADALAPKPPADGTKPG